MRITAQATTGSRGNSLERDAGLDLYSLSHDPQVKRKEIDRSFEKGGRTQLLRMIPNEEGDVRKEFERFSKLALHLLNEGYGADTIVAYNKPHPSKRQIRIKGAVFSEVRGKFYCDKAVSGDA